MPRHTEVTPTDFSWLRAMVLNIIELLDSNLPSKESLIQHLTYSQIDPDLRFRCRVRSLHRIEATISKITEEDLQLGETLRELAQWFNHEEILSLIHQARDENA